ncbi:hypothetical protein Pan153_41450 [Gimesia panareensis]|uniref:Glycosyltransferase RgtA/B/C/D-like domain-containing protein n=1 Tax=Gimesia panareensis TaxID=2527978 RepID=A0A518FT34_9PLAN|nr:hypothetical protein [Gimesia panareensis]QDV19480.1 hypothetical protein Pan153_41450 [Gimesia panareensis]
MTNPASSTDLSATDQIFHSARLRWCIYILLLTVTAGQSLAAIMNSVPLQSANDRSRWCTVWSLVEEGTYQIDTINDRSGWSSIDKVRHADHFYSSKPPLFPTLVAGLYWLIKTTTGLNLNQNLYDVAHLILIIVNLIPMLIALTLICRMVEKYAQTDFTRFFIVVSACFGTLLTPFLLTLNNHSIAASCAVFTLYPLMRIILDGNQKKRYFLLAGFFAMFTCCNELPAALFGLITFGLLFKANPRLTILIFVPAALVPLLGFFVTNYATTGGWKPFYMYYGTEKYLYEHKGIPSYWNNPQGLDRNLDSPLVYFFHCTLGHHGIFSLSPIYLLTLFSWLRIRQAAQNTLRPILWISLVLTVIVFGFYMSRTGNYNYGGNSSALRWMLWLTPFWLISMIPLLDQFSHKRWLQIFGVFCLLLSVFSAHHPLHNPWQAPWIYTWFKESGWIQYDQRPPAFERLHTSWLSSIPDSTAEDPEPFVEFTGPANDGRLIRLRINVVKPASQQDQNLRTIQVTRFLGSDEIQSSRYTVDVAAFNAGKWPEEFLKWSDETVSQAEKYAAFRFFYGMPRRRAYNPGKFRHLFTPLRADAYRCQLAASQVAVTIAADTEAEKKLRYRTDLWLTDQIPFGVAQYETSVYDSVRGQLLSRQTLTVTSASGQTAETTE